MKISLGSSVTPRLADSQVLDLDGQPHRLGDEWRAQPVVLVFVRHFG